MIGFETAMSGRATFVGRDNTVAQNCNRCQQSETPELVKCYPTIVRVAGGFTLGH